MEINRKLVALVCHNAAGSGVADIKGSNGMYMLFIRVKSGNRT